MPTDFCPNSFCLALLSFMEYLLLIFFVSDMMLDTRDKNDEWEIVSVSNGFQSFHMF